jgi:hypothetical protein
VCSRRTDLPALFLPACLPAACLPARLPVAGITAEGDNRVLFQKVTKELTAATHTPGVRARLAAGAARPPTVTAGVRGEGGNVTALQHC